MECHLCQRVAKALHSSGGFRVPRFYNTNGARHVKLSSWKELRENESCPTCSFIADSLMKENGSDIEAAECQFWLSDLWGGDFVRFKLISRDQNFDFNLPIYPLAKDYSNCVRVLMDQHWVDMKRVSEWIKCCDATHGKCYCRISHSGEPLPSKHMYLIDLSQNCLIEADGGERYVALSYVWGAEQQPFRTSRANLTLLKSNGGLANIKEKLPGTVQRAMHFTSMLGLELLWVDILCIVVDDPIHTATQIDDMAAIYSNSYLTVCAADGIDSSSGLRGVPECLQPRDVKQDVLTFNNGAMTSSWVMRVMGEASVYHKRAWTFQEDFLSGRTLFFRDCGLEWVCQELVSEEQCLGAQKPGVTYDGILRADVSWPSLKKWDNFVAEYLERKLTYEADVLRAFSGILRTLGRSMSGGFHFGLPEQFFDAALLWVPTETLTRREDLNNGNQRHEFPSWSWAGWKGHTESQINAFGIGHERSTVYFNYLPRNRDISPQVVYYKIEIGDNNEEHLVRISNDYARYQSEGLDGNLSLPLGWSSYRDEDDGTFYYRYDKAPKHTFWYPIPTVQDIQPGTRRQCDPCLFFITLRGYLEIASPLSKEEQNNRDYPLYHLHTENQEWAGVIYVHQPLSLSSGQTHRCELIVISAGFISEVEVHDPDVEKQVEWLPEFDFAGRPRSGDCYRFYHVLWIEREDGISYRRGLGRVAQEVWDDLPKDDVEIWLG